MEDRFWMAVMKLAIVAMVGFCVYWWWQLGFIYMVIGGWQYALQWIDSLVRR